MSDSIQEIFSKAMKEGRRVLLEPEAERVCASYGIPVAESYVTTTIEEASRKAEILGFPVVLKIVSPDIIHKTEVGGALAGIEDQNELREGYRRIVTYVRNRMPGATILGVLVQRMIPKGVEVMVGSSSENIRATGSLEIIGSTTDISTAKVFFCTVDVQ